MHEIEKSDSEWREQLSDEEFRVCRLKGTEAPFSGNYWDDWTDGIYRCTCCGETLFEADTKFDAGCGWPSFYQPVSDEAIRYLEDNSHGMQRIEIRCGSCDAHLGHVFPDGPQPTGERYCVNSASLNFTDQQGEETQG